MPTNSIQLPHVAGFDFGVGVERLTGSPMNQVVEPTPSPPLMAGGGEQSFDVTRIVSTRDLQESLGLSIEASYGCATFGAGASARFGFEQKSQVHESALFMCVTATVHHADLSIDTAVLTRAARDVADSGVFATRYGDMFCRAQKRGGLFVGLIRVETRSSSDASAIEGELKGSYGLFSAEAKINVRRALEEYHASAYCSIYAEGGPNLRIDDPTDPAALLDQANIWKEAMYADPERYSRPYLWILSANTIAEGPLPPNAADIEHCQDVLQFCARERIVLLDQLNELTWTYQNRDRFDWTGAAPQEDFREAARLTQADLETVASCASSALNSPTDAEYPAPFATARGAAYPSGHRPEPYPTERPGQERPRPTHRWELSDLGAPGTAAVESGVAVNRRSASALDVWWTAADSSGLHGMRGQDGHPWAPFELEGVYEVEHAASRVAPITGGSGFGQSNVAHVTAGQILQVSWWREDSPDTWYQGLHIMDAGQRCALTARLACAGNPDNYVFLWVTPDGSIARNDPLMYHPDPGPWPPNVTLWEPGTAATTAGVTASWSVDQGYDVAWVAPDGGVLVSRSRTDAHEWSDPQRIADGASIEASVALVHGAGRAYLVWVTADGSVRCATRAGDTWAQTTVAEEGSAAMAAAPAAVPLMTTVGAYWIGPDGAVEGATLDGDAWQRTPVAPEGAAAVTGALAAAARNPARPEVWWVASDGSVKWARLVAGTPSTGSLSGGSLERAEVYYNRVIVEPNTYVEFVPDYDPLFDPAHEYLVRTRNDPLFDSTMVERVRLVRGKDLAGVRGLEEVFRVIAR